MAKYAWPSPAVELHRLGAVQAGKVTALCLSATERIACALGLSTPSKTAVTTACPRARTTRASRMLDRLQETYLIGKLVNLLRRPAAFACVGLTNTAIDLTVFALLTQLVLLPPLVANVLSFSLGALNSFILNTLITFRDRTMGRWSFRRMLRFAAVAICALSMSSIVLGLFLMVLPVFAAKVASVIVMFSISYLLNTTLVFVGLDKHRSPAHPK